MNHTPPNAPINPKDGLVIARMAIAQAHEHGARAALAGGLAMMVYGSDRMTADVDIMTDDPDLKLGKPGKALSFGGRSYTERGIVLDIIRRDDAQKDVYDAALGDVRRLVPWKGEERIEVLSAEWLALIKLLAGRGKDMLDLQYLIKSKSVNRKRLLNHCKGIYGRHAYTVTDDLEQEFTIADSNIKE